MKLPLLAMFRQVAIAIALSLTLLAGYAFGSGFSAWSSIRPAIEKVPSSAGPVYDQYGNTNNIKIKNWGTVVYTGPVNVKPTLDRIRNNSKLPHGNDGGVYNNNNKKLPISPSGYYREFVHWPYSTSSKPYGMTFPGPMRVILGRNGEVYFTGDHYSSFYDVN